jgi:RimJ/RimL family protein N-acetyltransferase
MATTDFSPPAQIDTATVSLRRWTESDADALRRAVTESFDHLSPWMPWVIESPSIDDELEFIRGSNSRWETGEAYEYALIDPAVGTVIGAAGLHTRVGPKAWDLGYWVHPAYTRHGIATAAAGALTEIAFAWPGTARMEIHCDEANLASAGVPRRLGYVCAETCDHEPAAPGETGRRMIWVMHRAEHVTVSGRHHHSN